MSLKNDIYTYIYIYHNNIYLYAYDWIEITIQVTCYCQSSYESLCQQFWDHLWFLLYGNTVRVELNCTTYTICILPQTNSMHEACISTVTRSEVIEQYPLTSFKIIAGWFRAWVCNQINELVVKIFTSSSPSMLGPGIRRYVVNVMAWTVHTSWIK